MSELNVLALRLDRLVERDDGVLELRLGRVESSSEVEEENSVGVSVEVVVENVAGGGDVDSADTEGETVSVSRINLEKGDSRRTGDTKR